jgi:hypothetical protein
MQGLSARASAPQHLVAVNARSNPTREDVTMMPDLAGASSDLVRAGDDVSVATSGSAVPELQRTCLAVLRAEWSTLAVVAVDARTGAVELASALADTARAYRLGRVRTLNASGGEAAVQPSRLLDTLAETRGTDVRTAIALGDPNADPERIPVLLAADAVVLVVRLGTSAIRAVEALVELVGRERVVGCVVVPS